MGVIRCPEHGLSFIQRCCEHIARTIDAEKHEPTNFVVDGAGSAVMLCAVCLPAALAQTGSLTEDWKDIEVVHECGEHAAGWFLRTSQGDLLDSIARLKSSAL